MSESWNKLEDKKSGQLACINPKINQQKWTQTLVHLDQLITQAIPDDIIVISLPYTLDGTGQALHENKYIDDVCIDNIIAFLAPAQNYMETIMSKHDDESKEAFILNSNDPETDFNRFNISKYDQLVSTQAMIIINIKEGSYISIPRNVEQLSSDWFISWFGAAPYAILYDKIFDSIQSRLPNHFKSLKNLGKRTAEIASKIILSEWHFNATDSACKPHSAVLLHAIASKSSRRKLWVDGREKYNNESTASSFRIEIDKDVVRVDIDYNEEKDAYSYRLSVNDNMFQDQLKETRRKKKVVVSTGYGKKKVDLSKMYGKIQFVNHFADYKVEIVNHFADLKVQKVNHFANVAGKWQIVNNFPDYKIQIVKSFADFKIQYVNHFPGVVKK